MRRAVCAVLEDGMNIGFTQALNEALVRAMTRSPKDGFEYLRDELTKMGYALENARTTRNLPCVPRLRLQTVRATSVSIRVCT